MKNYCLIPAYLCLVYFLVACTEEKDPISPYEFTELAMLPGMKIEAENKNGSVSIESLDSLKRLYKWDGRSEVRVLIPRTYRWYGMMGAYDPADAYIWEIFNPRIVAEDSQLYFQTMEEVEKWLYQSSAILDWVYNDEGLVVGFAKSPNRNQVNIEVYQIYLNGEKPNKLEGSRPENLKVSYVR